VGLCLASANLILILITTVIGQAPALVRSVGRAIRVLFLWSYRLYDILSRALNPLSLRFLKLDLEGKFSRTVFSMFLSALITSAFVGGLWKALPLWVIVLALLHGFFVGLLWHELGDIDGLRLGIDIE
jgi:hypothetical protein